MRTSPPFDPSTYHQLHPFTCNADLRQTGPHVLVAGGGSYLFDTSGRKILDALSGLWCVNVGYGRPELAKVAYTQMLTLPYSTTCFGTATQPSMSLAATLASLAPDSLNNVFFGTSGSDAIDTVVHMVRTYWNLNGQPRRKIIIGRHNGYHGSTLAAAGLGGMSAMHASADFPLPGFRHIAQPYWYALGRVTDPDTFGLVAARALEEELLDLGPEHVAAFIAEPIQGKGGVIIPPSTYWPEIQRICRKYDVLLVADEAVTGMGRTGRWFAGEHFGLVPDFITLAKGLTSGYLPLSAVLVGDRIADTLLGDGVTLQHGYTCSGHPVSCAVALENIRIIQEEYLLDHVERVISPQLRRSLTGLSASRAIGEVRLIGLMGAIEMDRDFIEHDRHGRHHMARLASYFFEKGLVVEVTDTAILFAPPFCWQKTEVDLFADLIGSGLRFLVE